MRLTRTANNGEWVRKVIEEYEAPLLRYAARLSGNLESARDLVQDTFLRLCSEDSEQLGERVAPWLYRVCRSRAVDAFRKEHRMKPLEDTALEMLESAAPTPIEALDREETESQVLKALSALPKNQQEVIRLKFQEGFSYREISEVTGHSVSNVGFLIHAGMKTLRQRLAGSPAGV